MPVKILPVSRLALTRVFGGEALLRSRPATRPGPAEACLRPEDVRVAPKGVAVRVVEARFMGDRSRITVAPVAAPEIELRAYVGPDVAEHDRPLRIAITSGWILPGG